MLRDYLNYCRWNVTQSKTIQYLNYLQKNYSKSTYRKYLLQVRLFLRYFDIDYLEKVKIPGEPDYTPKQVTVKDIERLVTGLSDLRNEKQLKALVFLGATTGMRPSELFRLRLEDIDISKRRITIHKSKTGKGRIAFFNQEAKKHLRAYLKEYKPDGRQEYLFGAKTIYRYFRKSPIKVKQLRKFFSQEWDRRGGSYAAKERLMGHSLNRIDFKHYSFLDENDLKRLYDEVMNR